jgi:hypothetical protein
MSGGRRAATVSLLVDVIAIVVWLVIARRVITLTASEWVWVVGITGAGVIALLSGLIALVRGRGLTRVAGIVGVLLSLWLILIGTAPLWFQLPNPLGNGTFA